MQIKELIDVIRVTERRNLKDKVQAYQDGFSACAKLVFYIMLEKGVYFAYKKVADDNTKLLETISDYKKYIEDKKAEVTKLQGALQERNNRIDVLTREVARLSDEGTTARLAARIEVWMNECSNDNGFKLGLIKILKEYKK